MTLGLDLLHWVYNWRDTVTDATDAQATGYHRDGETIYHRSPNGVRTVVCTVGPKHDPCWVLNAIAAFAALDDRERWVGGLVFPRSSQDG